MKLIIDIDESTYKEIKDDAEKYRKTGLVVPYLYKIIESGEIAQSKENDLHCNCTDEEINKSFVEDVEEVKHLLPRTGSED